MNTTTITVTIVSIVMAVLAVALGFIGYYFYIRSKIAAAINGEIDDAEKTNKAKEEKRAAVVENLRQLVPAVLKPIITDKMLTVLVQAAFDKIEAYARQQLIKKGGSGNAHPDK